MWGARCQISLTALHLRCDLASVLNVVRWLGRLVATLSVRLNGIKVSIGLIGWGNSAALLITLLRQNCTQWKTEATAGVSKWQFILCTALLGEALYLRNRRLQAARAPHGDGLRNLDRR